MGSHWVLEPVRVTSDSMSPTLSPGDHVLLLRMPWAGTVSRGDVVVVGPGWAARAATDLPLAGRPDAAAWVKRVVGVPGDVVGLEDGRLVVDGSPAVEPWFDQESMDGVYFGPVTVPPGAVFVMGDDRSRSVDSRDLGPVLLDEIEGRVVTPWPRS